MCLMTSYSFFDTCYHFGFNEDQLNDFPEVLTSKFNSANLAKKFSIYMEYEYSAPRAEQPSLYNILSHLLPVQSITWAGIAQSVGARFSAPVQTGPVAQPSSCTMGSGSFPGLKRPGRGVDHPPHLSAEVMKG